MTRPASLLAVALQIAALTSALQKNAASCPESAERATISERIARVREAFADRNKESDCRVGSQQLAQWVNWPNWGNWNNWANWNQWNNWGNWTKY
jgi:hypothetical protein